MHKLNKLIQSRQSSEGGGGLHSEQGRQGLEQGQQGSSPLVNLVSLSLSLKVRDLNPLFCYDLGEGDSFPLMLCFFFFFKDFSFNSKKKKTTCKMALF